VEGLGASRCHKLWPDGGQSLDCRTRVLYRPMASRIKSTGKLAESIFSMEVKLKLDLKQLSQDMCTINPDISDTYAQWGKLVKTWVTGISQFDAGKDYSIPAAQESLQPLGMMTKEQFQGMLNNAKVDMTIPDRVKRFVFVQDDDTTVIVRLPSKRVLEAIQGQLEHAASVQQEPYPLPAFYQENWKPAGQKALAKDELLKMHCQRIGEYTINTCG
jgi:hypothetical protein